MDTDGLIPVLFGALLLVADGWLYLFSERITTRLDILPSKFGHFLILIACISFFLVGLGIVIIFRPEKKG